ncbi:MAG: sigma 54-interacting transcriptional regulator [Deltaproteobacteria bacterium]|nr:sigma 54-interacting transcriptional regulator [Deltaproteobacteria bacterium]
MTNTEETACFEEPSIRLVSIQEDQKLATETLQLTVSEPSHKKRVVVMSCSPFRIGKGEGNDLVLSDRFVSDQHCRIRLKGEGWFLKDLSSTNGTLHNGERVSDTFLKEGDTLTVGETKILISLVQKKEILKTESEESFCGLIGSSEKMRGLYALIRRVAPADLTVLVQGETGSGKELVGRAVHTLSPQVKGPFVALNCGAISSELIESELFGHEKGAFTGAQATRKGAFETARDGTLFLDEIGELPLKLQPKLLRVLEQKTIRRVGGNAEIAVNCRIVAATHRNLKQAVEIGEFREDLFFRLHVIPLRIPALRERRDDIPLLIKYFLQDQKVALSKEAQKVCLNYDWPGNIRELKNVILRAALLSGDEKEISAESLQLTPVPAGNGGGDLSRGDVSLRGSEKEMILRKLDEFGGNKAKTAEALGIAKSTLFKKLGEYGIK